MRSRHQANTSQGGFAKEVPQFPSDSFKGFFLSFLTILFLRPTEVCGVFRFLFTRLSPLPSLYCLVETL